MIACKNCACLWDSITSIHESVISVIVHYSWEVKRKVGSTETRQINGYKMLPEG